MSHNDNSHLPDLPPSLTDKIVQSYQADDRTQHLDACFLPSRARTIEAVELLRRIIFPGFFDDQRITTNTVHAHVTDLLSQTRDLLYEQIHQAINYEQFRTGNADEPVCHKRSGEITLAFLDRLPEVRRRLATDIQAAYDGDPANVNTDETIFCYPGLDAIFIYRLAHVLYTLGVPMLPRIMTEYAHNETGIDIHPGATIGESFFIDHGTGVVIGETTVIGNHVQLYQGVTLGALAPKDGERWRGRRRHPTIGDRVTIYPGATILGGDTTIGDGCVINGSVFITGSVPPNHIVGINHPELKLRARRTPTTTTTTTPTSSPA